MDCHVVTSYLKDISSGPFKANISIVYIFLQFVEVAANFQQLFVSIIVRQNTCSPVYLFARVPVYSVAYDHVPVRSCTRSPVYLFAHVPVRPCTCSPVYP